MRGLWAGVLATVLTAGCKDNPGFALSPDGPVGSEPTTSTTDASTTVIDVSSSSAGDVTTVDVTLTSQGPSTTADDSSSSSPTTGEPPDLCGNGVIDGDEQCDDANDTPNDECTNTCRLLFINSVKIDRIQPCTGIGIDVAAFNENDSLDLMLVTDVEVPVLENDGEGKFSADVDHVFVSAGKPISGALPRRLGSAMGEPNTDKVDVVMMQVLPTACLADMTTGYCTSPPAKEYIIPPAVPGFESFVPKLLQTGLFTGNDLVLDLLVGIHDNEKGDALALLAGNADGTFDDLIPVYVPGPLQPATFQSLTLGHISGPLDLALGYTHEGDGKVLLVNNFSDSLDNFVGPFPVGESATSIAIAELGLGGKIADIIVADPVGGKIRFIGDGDGSKNMIGIQPEFIPIGATSTKVAAASLRGEGTWDILSFDRVTDYLLVASVVTDKPPDTFIAHATDLTKIADFVVADLDGDKDFDVALIDDKCSVQVLFNQHTIEP